jgi:hypothetical protein
MEQNLTLISAVPVEIDETYRLKLKIRSISPYHSIAPKKTGQKRRKDDMN